MFSLFRPRIRHGVVTEPMSWIEEPGSANVMGLPRLDAQKCTADGSCVRVCPSAAISVIASVDLDPDTKMWQIDYGACVFCGRCAAACPAQAITMTTETNLSVRRRDDLVAHIPVVAREKTSHA